MKGTLANDGVESFRRVRVYSKLRRLVRQWLRQVMRPCRRVVSLMSESLERRLSIRERVILRLHLLVCAWCARYLEQIKFTRWLLRARTSRGADNFGPSLALEARERITRALEATCNCSETAEQATA